MSDYTKGPWIRDTSSGFKCDVRSKDGRKIALCFGLGGPKPGKRIRVNGGSIQNPNDAARFKAYRAECDANAKLISAAPELLEALIDITEAYCSIVGEPYVGPCDPEEDGYVIAARSAISKAEGK